MVLFGTLGMIAGAILVLMGAYLVFFFPFTIEHQPTEGGFTTGGIILGIIFLLAGILLIFLE
ncbi:MAG: hypothetical protein HYX24_07405 [Candidatus Aenigmarchaeota archaeon]|nr:hypothetical protein [Candidatus Aenigmarchaeota archaeon]